ncbi:MAG: Holliday junction resolvase RuvX [Actinobacteria bacterium]|nr:Holliday junction resolvase RuvX [Actinomycetota bacterium]MBU1493147.1 Holliday junction resolvase RuvX [Actinomycetota bacterium]MBU1866143.1 Holliday junction resolvase RuvX [Actinomycetota bacterium]
MSRIVGLDPGTVRIGVAVSDPMFVTAQPHGNLAADAEDLDDRLRDLAAETEAERFVVGLPIGLDGREGAAAGRSRELAARVAEATGLPVDLYDERFSTVTAERVLVSAGVRRSRRKVARDRVAAAVFLQAYLDGRR